MKQLRAVSLVLVAGYRRGVGLLLVFCKPYIIDVNNVLINLDVFILAAMKFFLRLQWLKLGRMGSDRSHRPRAAASKGRQNEY